jgi:hypothetical protein
MQFGDRQPGQRHPVVREQVGRFVDSEREVFAEELGQLIVRPPPMQREGRVPAAGQDQPGPARGTHHGLRETGQLVRAGGVVAVVHHDGQRRRGTAQYGRQPTRTVRLGDRIDES